MTRGKYDDPVFREDAFVVPQVPASEVWKSDHLEIRTRLSAAVTTTQLLLERLKRYQRIILGKCSFGLTGPQKYVIGLRPSVYEMYRQKWPLKLLQ